MSRNDRECAVHNGAIHGGEAEELRSGIETLIEHGPYVTSSDLQCLLDRINDRDSLAWLDQSGPVTGVPGLDFHRWRGAEYLVSLVLNGAQTPDSKLTSLRELSRIMSKKMKHGGGMLQPWETEQFALFEALGSVGENAAPKASKRSPR